MYGQIGYYLSPEDEPSEIDDFFVDEEYDDD